MASSRRVGILGSGDVAKSLGRGFARLGYEVRLGTREPGKLESWKREVGARASVGSFAEAADHGELAVVATRGAGAEAALEQAGPKRFAGKVVLDTTNPLDFSAGGEPGLLFGVTDSLGERIQRRLGTAKVVKCFNTVGHQRMAEPKFASGPARMWICGNDAGAKAETDRLLREFGWAGALDVGGIEASRWLEAMIPLWFRAGQALGTWEHVLQVWR
jgi:8-hydroxy-5-deazaflavin:NADPH oxidoreductase